MRSRPRSDRLVAGAEAQALAVGAAIRSLRLERGLTQEALAFSADVTVGQLSKIECAKADPRLRTLAAIANALTLSTCQLVQAAECHPSTRRGLPGGRFERANLFPPGM